MILTHPAPLPTKINMGCGYDKQPGYLNIDSDPATEPDFLVRDNDLSVLPQGYFEEIFANDVLEHIPRIFTASALFDWALLLKPGGRLFVQSSYIFGVIDVMRRTDTFKTAFNWNRCLFGNQAHPGDYHFTGFTHKTLRTYLRAVGFTPDDFQIKDDWLIYGWAARTENWSELLGIEDYRTFVERAYDFMLARPPEDYRMGVAPTLANSRERMAEIKVLATADERLYRLGADETVPY